MRSKISALGVRIPDFIISLWEKVREDKRILSVTIAL